MSLSRRAGDAAARCAPSYDDAPSPATTRPARHCVRRRAWQARAFVFAVVVLALVGCVPDGPVVGQDRPDVVATDRTDAGTPDSDARAHGIPADAHAAVVASITDGDTLRVRLEGDSEAVRLLEVDAPETNRGCGASQSTEFVRRFVPPGSTVWLERDDSDRDRYGRLLRYVWRDDAELLNERLVEAGWAEAKLYEPDDGRWPTMQQAQRKARDARAGMWKLCDMGGAAGEQPASDRSCDPNYSGCVPVYPPDVDCDRINGPVTVLGDDPHNIDGNHEGQACEGPPP